MALSLKNEETERLARELARRTGESLTVAVTVALQERLERQSKTPDQGSRVDRIMRIADRTAPLMKDSRTSQELFDELYDDETGLPR